MLKRKEILEMGSRQHSRSLLRPRTDALRSPHPRPLSLTFSHRNSLTLYHNGRVAPIRDGGRRCPMDSFSVRRQLTAALVRPLLRRAPQLPFSEAIELSPAVVIARARGGAVRNCLLRIARFGDLASHWWWHSCCQRSDLCLLQLGDPQKAVAYGAAHGALAMTTAGTVRWLR